MFSCEYCEIYSFCIEHLPWLVLEDDKKRNLEDCKMIFCLDCYLKIGTNKVLKGWLGIKIILRKPYYNRASGLVPFKKIAFSLKVNCFIIPDAALLADVLENMWSQNFPKITSKQPRL